MTELSHWLKTIGLDKYQTTFADNEIDLEVLPELTEQDLKELGLPMGPRKKLLKAIAALNNATSNVNALASDPDGNTVHPAQSPPTPQTQRQILSPHPIGS